MFLRIVTLDWTVLLGALAFLFVARYISRRRIPKGLRLPPGPPGKFIFGNVSDLPTHHEWQTFAQWSKVYGDLVHIKVLNTRIVIVNSVDIAHELFEKRSSMYSDRFHSPMVHDLMNSGWVVTFMHYGEKWRRHRRTFNQKFHQGATVAYHEVQTAQTRDFLKELHKSPDKLPSHLRYLAGAIIMEIIYGIKVLPTADPYVDTAEEAMAAWSETAIPGAFLVDTFPILKYVPVWMPGAGFQRKARAWRVPIARLASEPFTYVKKKLAAGVTQPSFVASLLEDLSARSDASPDEEEVIRDTAAVAYLGGAETVVSSMHTFFLAMVLYPEVQRKAQEELDTVLGPNRLPSFEDREDLPYINVLCNEVIRWHPVLPTGVAHRVTKDDVYGDFFIPEGSILMGNSWAMLHDEKNFGPEPEKFIPERFFEPGVGDPIYAFGFGRRICPGRYMGANSLFIAIASILKVFDIAHARDGDGNEIPVKDDVTSGLLSHPQPFECDIKPRSASAERLLSSEHSN